MQDDRFTFSETDVAAALRALRESLGKPPEVMAQILGCSLPAYQKWEMGAVVPGGEWLIRMLQLCPNENIRNLFRIRAERRASPREQPHEVIVRSGSVTDDERRRLWQTARLAVDTLYECGARGMDAADRRLADFAVNLESAAAYYRNQMEECAMQTPVPPGKKPGWP